MTTSVATAVLRPREERRLLRGHPWAYRNEFANLPELDDGGLVRVNADKGRCVGFGYYQKTGGIAVRLLTVGDAKYTEELLPARVDNARQLRERLYPGSAVYRWIHGESDGLPGLIADRYGSLVVLRAASAFYRSHAERLADAFLRADGVAGVLCSIDSEKIPFGDVSTPVACELNGLKFEVDPESGQKTGLFLDQRVNWTLMETCAPGARVLDGHCYVGAWGLHAARHGAKEILGIDTSRPAIDRARDNAERNNLGDRCTFAANDIKDVLARGETWDVIVLDPPAFAKSKGHLKKALGLYQALNRDAFKALAPGGVLITSTCSQPLDPGTFVDLLKRAANAAQRRCQLLDLRGAAPDHPVLLSMPESHYLTCAVVRAIG